MLGIDIARMKRAYEDRFPTYNTTDYKNMVEWTESYGDDFRGGENIRFHISTWNLNTQGMVRKFSAIYNRFSYGGWETVDWTDITEQAATQSDSEEENTGNNNSVGGGES